MTSHCLVPPTDVNLKIRLDYISLFVHICSEYLIVELFFLQQISQHQELFIQMLNEPVGEGGDPPEVGELGAAGEEGTPVNYIQVTAQEKEAIERVSG